MVMILKSPNTREDKLCLFSTLNVIELNFNRTFVSITFIVMNINVGL